MFEYPSDEIEGQNSDVNFYLEKRNATDVSSLYRPERPVDMCVRRPTIFTKNKKWKVLLELDGIDFVGDRGLEE